MNRQSRYMEKIQNQSCALTCIEHTGKVIYDGFTKCTFNRWLKEHDFSRAVEEAKRVNKKNMEEFNKKVELIYTTVNEVEPPALEDERAKKMLRVAATILLAVFASSILYAVYYGIIQANYPY